MTSQFESTTACGCSDAPDALTPAEVRNRPGLSKISYRAGTFATFRRAMIEAIATARVDVDGQPDPLRPLDDWTARTNDDYGIALVTMWAYLADILTFYQERIANEAYLRTALFQESLLCLAATLDYVPAAGVAATAHLAFAVEPDKRVDVPAGLLVQSVPGQGEQPQKFETIQTVEAFASLNEIGLRATRPHKLVMGDTQATVTGTNLAVKPGNYVLIVGDELVADPGSERWDLRRVEAVDVSQARGTTTLHWAEGLGHAEIPFTHPAENPRLYVFRQQAWPFGYNAPNFFLIPDEIRELAGYSDWSDKHLPEDPGHPERIFLDNVYEGIERGSWVALILGSPPTVSRFTRQSGHAEVYQILNVDDTARENYTIAARMTCLTVPTIKERREGRDLQQPEHIDLFPVRGTTIWVKSEELELAETPIETPAAGSVLVLDGHYRDLHQGRQLILVGQPVGGRGQLATETIEVASVTHEIDQPLGPPTLTITDVTQPAGLVVRLQAAEDPVSAFLVTQLGVDTRQRLGFYQPGNPPAQALLDLVVRDLNRLILDGPLYDEPLFADVALSDEVRQLIDARPTGEALHRLNRLLLEEVFPQDVAQTRRQTSITLTAPLAQPYAIESVRLFGNVALATHGETIENEVLGSGDASTDFQEFALRKSPVTYVPRAGAPHGAASTLQVRVDGVLWREVRNLLGQGDGARVYTTRIDAESTTRVHFGGDGAGAHLSTGRNNVVARYRRGIGSAGNVAAGAIKTLLNRPVGLNGATNPAAASGGAEGESREKIRRNVPNTVRTFGRIVSLRDFEDAAREFAGIAKAKAFVEGVGVKQRVRLTVAGDDGAEVAGPTLTNLINDLNARRDPNRPLAVASYTSVPIVLQVAIWIDPTRLAEDVQAAAVTALMKLMQFDNLDLGQPIHLSDVFKAVHDVEGVVAADVNGLQYKNPADAAPHGATDDPVQTTLRMFATELAVIQDPITDMIVTKASEN